MNQRQKIILGLIFAGIAIFNFWGLMRYPAPSMGETWFLSRSWAFKTTHLNFGALDTGVFDRYPGYWTFFPFIPTLLQTVSQLFTAVPSLFASRLISLLMGMVLLGAIFSIGFTLGGFKLAVSSTLLASLSSAFIYSAHSGRIDSYAAALGFLAIALFIQDRPSKLISGFLPGLLIGLAFEIHPHSVVFGPVIVALAFLKERWQVMRQAKFWAFVGGAFLGLAVYVILHILPYPQTFFALNRIAFGPTHTPPIFTFSLQVLWESVSEMGLIILAVSTTQLIALIWALGIGLLRRNSTDQVLLTLILMFILGFVLFVRNKLLDYAILFSPAVDICVASLILDVFTRPWRGKVWDFLSRCLVGWLVLSSVVMNLSNLRTDQTRIFQSIQGQILALVQPGDVIMGSQVFWLDLYDHPYYSWEELVYYQRQNPTRSLEDAFREFHPNILIIDQSFADFISDSPGDSLYKKELRVSKTELDRIIEEYGTKLGELEVSAYGKISIFRLRLQ